MTPRCDGCRYWVGKAPEHISGEWVPHIGPREDPNARVVGWCRRYPQLQGKAPGDWCGEFAATPGTKIETPTLEAQ